MKFVFISPLVLLAERGAFVDELSFLVVSGTGLAELLATSTCRLSLVAFDPALTAPVAGAL